MMEMNVSDSVVENAAIQYQDYSGEWNTCEVLGRSSMLEVLNTMKSVQRRFNGKRVRCIEHDTGRLVDIL
jgi:hypothetical protein